MIPAFIMAGLVYIFPYVMTEVTRRCIDSRRISNRVGMKRKSEVHEETRPRISSDLAEG